MLWLCLTISVVVVQVPSPTGQLVSSVPLEQTPAEEESRKSMSRSFKGTMASSTERRFLFFWKAFIGFHQFGNRGLLLDFSPACEDVLTPAAVADTAVKTLNSCLATMPAGEWAQTHWDKSLQKDSEDV